MKNFILLLMGTVSLAGCSAGPVDLTSAYWDGQTNLPPKAGMNWPNWSMAPARGVRLGVRSSPPGDKMEYATFLWNETGIYGNMFGFRFRKVSISRTDSDGQQYTVVIDNAAGKPETARYHTLGKIAAWEDNGNQGRKPVPAAQFRYVDDGWISKPGQCRTQWWLSWKALGSDGPPVETVTIRLKEKSLFLPGRAATVPGSSRTFSCGSGNYHLAAASN
ncbi:MAG: hypothetical protein KAV00_04550 [Phycisphaerae bacterium]|nr:hypothetical protein [Phycisphaerae bacterium]